MGSICGKHLFLFPSRRKGIHHGISIGSLPRVFPWFAVFESESRFLLHTMCTQSSCGCRRNNRTPRRRRRMRRRRRKRRLKLLRTDLEHKLLGTRIQFLGKNGPRLRLLRLLLLLLWLRLLRLLLHRPFQGCRTGNRTHHPLPLIRLQPLRQSRPRTHHRTRPRRRRHHRTPYSRTRRRRSLLRTRAHLLCPSFKFLVAFQYGFLFIRVFARENGQEVRGDGHV